MTNSKTTRRALISSALAVLMCAAMLVGTTFAWFTDTASTGVNKIAAGNLDVQIQNEAGETVDTLEWIAADGRAQKDILWEPGCRYTLTPFKIVNTGSLALKYKIVITGLDGDADLLKVIKFTYTTEDGTFDMTEEGHLAANGGATKLITVTAKMDTAAGNEYMNKKLDGVNFTVLAAQDTVESDSFDNKYDENAEYPDVPVGTTINEVFGDLKDKDGNNIDFGVNAPAKDLSIDGQGVAVVTGFSDSWIAGDVTIKGVKFLNGACFTAKDDGTKGTVTFENCTFYACDQSKIDLTPYRVNSLKNSGDGLCLNIETKNSPELKVVIKNCRFVGEDDVTLNRDGWKDIGGKDWNPDTAVKNKSRGHAIMINGICGGGNNATAESVLIDGCTMDGIRGHAIQLYQLRMGVTVKNCKINSWGNNAQTEAGTKQDAAIRGDIVSGSLTLSNNSFGLDESSSRQHVNVGNFDGNTTGSREAGTY